MSFYELLHLLILSMKVIIMLLYFSEKETHGSNRNRRQNV